MNLDSLELPAELKSLTLNELQDLAQELRARIVAVSLKNGGHLGASLGTVEIALALHRIFESPREPILWDVGHQAYAHKLLTGRAASFGTLRKTGGISGFLSREESPHDVFGAGHSSTSLSAALGFAYGSEDWTVAVVGDGGLTAGLAFEALNQFSSSRFGPMLVVLNDNRMSISENVGAIPELLARGGAKTYFEGFGAEYVGPVDGHDLSTLLGVLNGIHASRPDRPVVLHTITQKGRGYAPAEDSPRTFHGVGPVQATQDKLPGVDEKPKAPRAWSDWFGEALIRLAEKDPRIVAITAAMPEGTGLVGFAERFPDRFFDVGIAEPHAVVFAAGLAAHGWKPVVAVYSTFLQRGFDAMIHDVAIQNLPVVFAVDRAGLVGADGPTHHGAFDLAYASMIPGFTVQAPVLAGDLAPLLESALKRGGPTLIRYPRGAAVDRTDASFGASVRLQSAEETKNIVVGVGTWGVRAQTLVERIASDRPELGLSWAQLLQVKPLPEELMFEIARHPSARITVLEEGSRRGGVGEHLASLLPGRTVEIHALPDRFVAHGGVADLEKQSGLDPQSIEEALRR